MPVPSVDELLGTWERTLGERFPLRRDVAEQFLSVHVDPAASASVEGGLVVAKRHQGRGWIAALLVEPDRQGRGAGRRLLEHAVDSLRRAGATELIVGGDYLHLLPGIPDPGPAGFFRRCGFEVSERREVDLATSLDSWNPSLLVPEAAPARSWDEVLAFLAAEFPGRWHWEAEEARRRGGVPDYYLLLGVDGEAAGFARVHHQQPGSPAAGLIAPSTYWSPARPGFGGLGPIGVGRAFRGRGFGLGLLEAAMARLKELGVRELAVDWTTLVDFYARVGLEPCRAYRRARRRLA